MEQSLSYKYYPPTFLFRAKVNNFISFTIRYFAARYLTYWSRNSIVNGVTYIKLMNKIWEFSSALDPGDSWAPRFDTEGTIRCCPTTAQWKLRYLRNFMIKFYWEVAWIVYSLFLQKAFIKNTNFERPGPPTNISSDNFRQVETWQRSYPNILLQ